ncbi:MAG: hypothetical protein LUD15_09705 [Bacteroides sp.]|nr:hypothetical protein [Bacteroides sp.]
MKAMYVLPFFIVGLLLVGCHDDNKVDPGKTEPGEELTIQLMIKNSASDRSSAETRAPGGKDQATTEESKLRTEMVVAIFNSSDVLEYYKADETFSPLAGSPGTYRTSPIPVNVGIKYIYVFSLSDNTTVQTPGIGSPRSDFEQQVLDITFNNDVPHTADATQYFLNQSLWRGMRYNVNREGQIIEIDLGRSVAKADFDGFTKGTATTLQGDFTNLQMRLASVPARTYLLGHHDSPNPTGPYESIYEKGVEIISAVHQEHFYAGNGATETRNPVYRDYDWDNALVPKAETGNSVTYLVKNTSTRFDDNYTGFNYQNKLRYGTVTHAQVLVVYTPTDGEYTLLNGTWQIPQPTEPGYGPTYWHATFNDWHVELYPQDPRGNATYQAYDPEPVLQRAWKGLCLYRAPIKDPNEDTLDFQCRVLRNHWYTLSVTDIYSVQPSPNNIDEPDPENPVIPGPDNPNPKKPDPVPSPTPIEEDGNIVIQVKVKEWGTVDVGMRLG